MGAKITTTVSSRGQITLPADLRERLGLQGGRPIILEERDGSLVISAAAVMAIEVYSEKRVEDFMREDRLTAGAREKIEKLRPKRARKIA